MHMPGHKRNPLCMMPDPYSLDVTEVPGVDDLHHPLEMIRDLMDELTKYYDSKQTSFGQWKYVRDFGGDYGVLLSGGQDFGGEKLS